MKEPMLTFDVDCVTQNNRNSWVRTTASTAMHVFCDCSELRDLRYE